MTGYEDCPKQRNLTDAGRSEARAIGAAIKRLGVPVGSVMASPFCRTMETAQLIFDRAVATPAARGGPASVPAERYAGAWELAADVENWLAGEPVGAWHRSRLSRLFHWLGRHRESIGLVKALYFTWSLVTALYDGWKEAAISTEMTFEDGRKGTINARVKVHDVEVHPAPIAAVGQAA